jgi:hypothetical protein
MRLSRSRIAASTAGGKTVSRMCTPVLLRLSPTGTLAVVIVAAAAVPFCRASSEAPLVSVVTADALRPAVVHGLGKLIAALHAKAIADERVAP